MAPALGSHHGSVEALLPPSVVLICVVLHCEGATDRMQSECSSPLTGYSTRMRDGGTEEVVSCLLIGLGMALLPLFVAW